MPVLGFDIGGLAQSYANAVAYAGDSGRVLSLPDILELRADPKLRDSDVWRTNFATSSTEYYGQSKGGVPVMAILHGEGPLSDVDAIRHRYVTDNLTIDAATFHAILDGRYGHAELVDWNSYCHRPWEDERFLPEHRLLDDAWFLARMGGRDIAERHLKIMSFLFPPERPGRGLFEVSEHDDSFRYMGVDISGTRTFYRPNFESIGDGSRALAGMLAVSELQHMRNSSGKFKAVGLTRLDDVEFNISFAATRRRGVPGRFIPASEVKAIIDAMGLSEQELGGDLYSELLVEWTETQGFAPDRDQ